MALPFNKMFIMLPLMFAARKLDAEDPNVIYWLRISYGIVQTLCVAAVIYTYLQASNMAGRTNVVYVPPAPVPFADPNAKKKYTEIAFGKHVQSTARSLLFSTLFGIAMTCGLHYYRGMITALAIQSIMAPLNLVENPIVKAIFLGGGIKEEDRIFDEKTAAELSPDDEVVDEQGNAVVRATTGAGNNALPNATKKADRSLEEVLLDTWDAAAKADLSDLMEMLNKKNCNYQTSEDHWTPLMILAGLGAPGTGSAIRQVLHEYGANPAVVDKDGWNALHWAAFHGSPAAARELKKETNLISVKDKEGYTPVDLARKEGNDEVANLFEAALGESKKSK